MLYGEMGEDGWYDTQEMEGGIWEESLCMRYGGDLKHSPNFPFIFFAG
jgi:hypothetical protein